MSTTENTVKSRAAKTGPFATLSGLLRGPGSGAPAPARLATLTLTIAALVAMAFATSAPAAGVRPPLASLSHSGYTNTCGDAVDSHGNLYVVNQGTVTVYDPAGVQITSFAVPGAFPCALALDAAGNVYVAQITGPAQKYEPSAYPPTGSTTYELDKSLNESSPGANDGNGVVDPGPVLAVAVNPSTGDVYTSHQGTAEQQTLNFTGFNSGDSFTVTNLPAQCSAAQTAPITYAASTTGKNAIRDAVRAVCGGSANVANAVGNPPATTVVFKGALTGYDFAPLSCSPQGAATGSCSSTEALKGAPGHISQFHSNGTLVTDQIGSAMNGGNYSGLDVYATNGRVFAFANDRIAIFNPGAASPTATIDGSGTPTGAMGPGFLGSALAVDQATGHVFAFDVSHALVNEFKPNGDFVTQLTDSLLAPASGPPDIAIDNSGGANDGTIYVADETTVQAFGKLEHAPLASLSHSGYTNTCGDAVDSHGNLYVVNQGTVTVYDPAGVQITSFAVPGAFPCALALDAAGNVYVAQITGPAQKYEPSAYPPTGSTTYELDKSLNESSPGANDGNGVVDPGPVLAVAVNPSTGDVYTSHQGTAEQQTLNFTGFNSGDSFTVTNLPAQCSAAQTAPITYAASTTGKNAIRDAVRAVCGGSANVANAVGNPPATTVVFKGALTGYDFAPLSCSPQGAATGSCSSTEALKGAPGHISQFHSNGTLVTDQIGSAMNGGNYSGLDVYATNGRVFAFANDRIAIFNPGAASPTATIDGSGTPTGAMGPGFLGSALAVDQATGHVFAFDVSHALVNEFKPNGDFVTQLTDSLLAPASGPPDIAIDNSGGANDGTIYVADETTVQAFGPMSYDDQLTLSAVKLGNGTGTITSVPAGIDCGSTCDAGFDPGTAVVLTATADVGSAFAGWQDCDSVDVDGKCHIAVNANTAVTATFIKRTLTVSKNGLGAATITSSPAGIVCGATCVANFDDGAPVTLTAAAVAGSRLKSWSGCDSLLGDQCTVTMSADRSVTATIAVQPTISATEATAVGSTTAMLKATVNPNGEATAYRFEYLSQADYEANGDSFSGPNEPQRAPASPAAIGAGNSPVAVSEQIEGLQAQTAYRFRLLATSFASPPGGTLGPEATFTTYAPAPLFPPCDNEAYRTGPSAHLPDCRAYEQASPVDKNGGNVQGEVFTVKAASEGAAISFESPAGIPGGEGSQGFPTYLASRQGGAWSTHGLLPDANAGTSAKVEGWTEDFATVFDSVGELGFERALVRRASGGGPLEPILDYTSPEPSFSFIDSTADASRVLFQAGGAGGALVPGAVAGAQNLYAWDAAAPAAVRFVGYLPDGSGPPGETRAGQFGSNGYNRDLNALSEAGDSVYFTAAGPGNLYRRLNPTAEETTNRDGKGDCVPDPALACTVRVNASEKTNGGAPEGHDTPGQRSADFMAASADGRVAYFTSAEKLTNDATTGPEPAPPALGRAGIGGAGPEAFHLISSAAGIGNIDVDANYIYWSDDATDSIGRIELDGGDFNPAFITGLDNPRGIALDGVHIYWTEAGDGTNGDGTIGRADLNGQSVDHSFITGASGPQGIDVDPTHIYWVNSTLSAVGRAAIGGASPVQEFFHSAVDGDIAVDGEYIYYSYASGGGFVRRRDLAGSSLSEQSVYPVSPILAGATQGPSIALDASHLYFANPTTGAIGRADLHGSSPVDNPTELIADALNPQGLALDAAHIYWTSFPQLTPNPGNDLYRYQADAPAGERLTDVSVDTTEIDGAKVQGVLGTSKDGSRVYYAANGVPDGTIHNSPNPNGEVPLAGDCEGTGSEADPYEGDCNLYLWQGGETTFIARLDADGGAEGDFSNWVPTPSVNGTFGSQYQRTARVSADGEVLLFRSLRRLTGYDNEGNPELYRYRVGEAALDCVSCDPTGAAPHGKATLFSMKAAVLSAFGAAPVLSRNLSADGNRVFFETVDALVAADTNGLAGCPAVGSPLQFYPACQDVYEWEANGTGSCESDLQNGGCLYLLSSGKDDRPSFFGDANESGDDAFVFTSERLVPQDEDDLLDAYDARVGGGLAYQHATESAPCQGEACMPTPSPAPGPVQPGSAGFTGPTDPKPAREHAKKKHGKKKHKHRRHGKARKHRRAAKTSGRAGR